MFIDGNHAYREVVLDVAALFALNRRPHAAAFRDFSLRSKNPDHGHIRVNEAIFD